MAMARSHMWAHAGQAPGVASSTPAGNNNVGSQPIQGAKPAWRSAAAMVALVIKKGTAIAGPNATGLPST